MHLLHKIKVKAAARLPKPHSLERKLMREAKTRWLDIGGSDASKGFICLDIRDPKNLALHQRESYVWADVLQLDSPDLARLGTFDLVRMQHTFEHFSPEEGRLVLSVAASLLRQGGFLLISVPDLRIQAKAYLQGYRWDADYPRFAHSFRVPHDAPASFIFSTFVHQDGYSPCPAPGCAHKWCYDYEGLEFLVRKANQFHAVRRLDILNSLASIPFTHNRPSQDVCLLAVKS